MRATYKQPNGFQTIRANKRFNPCRVRTTVVTWTGIIESSGNGPGTGRPSGYRMSGRRQIIIVRRIPVKSDGLTTMQAYNYLGLRWMKYPIKNLQASHRLRIRSKKTATTDGCQQGARKWERDNLRLCLCADKIPFSCIS